MSVKSGSVFALTTPGFEALLERELARVTFP